MSKPVQIIIKLHEQEVYFDGQTYPHYEMGWKKDDKFFSWQGCERIKEEVADWFQIIP